MSWRPAAAAILLLALSSCAAPVLRDPSGAVHPRLQALQARGLRRHFTRSATPEGLAFRWVEASLVDPAWVRAETAHLAQLGEWPPALVERRLRERLHDLAPGEGSTFELWLLTECHRCEELDRWYWMLQGPDSEAAAAPPAQIRWEVVAQEAQTLRWLGIERRIRLKKVRAVLRFPQPLTPGRWVLHGLPFGWHPSFSFEWRVAAPDEHTGEAGS